MANILKILRSITPGSRPTGKTYGEPYVNLGDNQFGVLDSSNVARDLIGVPMFSAAKSYVAGNVVNYQGLLYAALGPISPGSFNSTQWSQIASLSTAASAGDLLYSFDATPPAGCVELDGSTITGGVTSYPKVSARYPWMKVVNDLHLPDVRGKFPRIWAHGSAWDPDRASRAARAGDGLGGDNPGTYQLHEFYSHVHGPYSGGWYYGAWDGASTSVITTGTGQFAIGGAWSSTAYSGGGETRGSNINICVWMRMG